MCLEHWAQDRALTVRRLSPRVEESGHAESQPLQGQVETLQGLLKQVQEHVARQAQGQAEAQARNSLLQESLRLRLWAENIQAQLRSKEELVDVASAQRQLWEHGDLLEEIHLWRESMAGSSVISPGRSPDWLACGMVLETRLQGGGYN
ncbi:hypothetical protein P7K49_017608 [Saguinus oedipus]|uniref:Uncharacterized protein n=1 Tax=Saguinus oedipus TaxID=9490 RepID=A0ABQ9V3E6_SAGOE|nr:hypothetical protein P7K49_017608 [Saguinus oedipus]